MKKSFLMTALMAMTTTAMASEDKHFDAQMPTSFMQAQQQLVEGKAELAKIVADGEVSMAEMGKVHQLTYSLENALEFMEEEMEQIQETLERVHKGSEHGTNQQVLQDSQQFLKDSGVLHSK
ncbi:DUF6746 family protein [Thiomicrorhabdus indica]|uniref:DUF6746 family protein n=1 Tax=Thiomicrorhabdus indica TaxID=2267253 RepID=UPI002AA87F67|nr:DUF6746 family protein [Thiomicrorhabdus indica]